MLLFNHTSMNINFCTHIENLIKILFYWLTKPSWGEKYNQIDKNFDSHKMI